ncbi:MAG: hypothetical protein WKF80_02900, partial [Thermomicrobiales bacterium]
MPWVTVCIVDDTRYTAVAVSNKAEGVAERFVTRILFCPSGAGQNGFDPSMINVTFSHDVDGMVRKREPYGH